MSERVPALTACVVVFFLTLFLRLYWMEQRETFHIDEGLTFATTFYKEYPWQNFEIARPLTGKELKQSTVYNNASFKDLVKDLYKLHIDVRFDDHTNLYFSLLRGFFGAKGTQNFYDLRNGGIYFNIILFLISFILSLYIFYSAGVEIKAIPLLLLTIFASTGSIATTIFIRPYQLQETTTLLLCAILFYFYQKDHLESKNYLIFSFLVFAFSTLLLSGYFSIIFTTILLLLLISLTKNKLFFIYVYIASFIVATAYYAKYFGFLISGRTAEAASTFSSQRIIQNIYDSVAHIPTIFNNAFGWPLAVLLALTISFIIWKKALCEPPNILFIFFSAGVISMGVIIFLAPYKIFRYISPYIVLLFFPLSIYSTQIKKYSTYIVLSCLCIASLMSSFIMHPDVPIQKTNLEAYLQESSNIPIVAYSDSTWKYFTFIPTLPDTAILWFANDLQSLKKHIINYPEATVIIPQGTNILIPENYTIISQFTASYFKIFYIKHH